MSLRFWLLLAVLWFMSSPVRAQVAIDWVPMNSGIEGGEVRQLWQSPAGTFFAGGHDRGFFRSEAFLSPWEPIYTMDFAVGKMGADSSGHIFVSGNGGVFESSDEGRTWRQTDMPLPASEFATLGNGSIFAATSQGVYKRLADGHWEIVSQWTSDLSGADNIVEGSQRIAGMGIRGNGDLIIAAGSMLFTTQDGETWECFRTITESETGACWKAKRVQWGSFITAGIKDLLVLGDDLRVAVSSLELNEGATYYAEADSFKQQYGAELYIDQITTSSAHYVVNYSSGGAQVFDKTSSLSRRPKSKDEAPWPILLSGHRYIYSVTAHQNDAWVCAGPSTGIHCTTDQGKTWIDWHDGLHNTRISGLHYSLSDRLFVGARYGASIDLGEQSNTWEPLFINEIKSPTYITQCHHTPARFTDGLNNVFITSTNTSYTTQNINSLWEASPYSLEQLTDQWGQLYTQKPASHTYALCGWKQSQRPLPETSCYRSNRKNMFTSQTAVYNLTATRLLRSTDNFETAVNIAPEALFFDGITVAPNGTLFLAEEGMLFVSEDEGMSWSNRSFPTEDIEILEMHADADGLLLAASTKGLYRSIDYGLTWEAPILSDKCLDRIEVSPQGSIVVSDQLLSNDRGVTWKNIDTPLSGRLVAMAFDKEGHLYAGTDGWGLFKSATPLHLASAPQQPTAPFTASLYPNPAQEDFVLHLNLLQLEDVRVDLYDLLGRHRGQLLNRPLTRGPHYLPLVRAGVASGSYVVRVSAGTQTQYLKLVFR